jgi:methionine--tRNA ligase beta chain
MWCHAGFNERLLPKKLEKTMSVPVKPDITFEDLEKIDIRAGTIMQINDVPRSDKVVQLTVDFGEFTRSILCGIKQERSDLQAMVGKQALFVVNLAPKKISGVVSEGMVFDIGYADGVVPAALSQPEFPVPNGSRAG